MNSILAGAPLHSTVITAMLSSAARTNDRVDTRTLLVELMRADSSGDWGRIHLYAGEPDVIARKPVLDRFVGGSANWYGVPLTDSCAAALEAAGRLAYRYELWPMPVGVLTLALVADDSSAAAQALRVDDLNHADLLNMVQSEVLGIHLNGIESILPTVLNEVRRIYPAPISRPRRPSRTAERSSQPRSLRRRWTLAGWFAGATVAIVLLGYAIDTRLLNTVSQPSLVANTVPVQRIRDFGHGCDSPRTYFPTLDPYAGPVPHPLTSFIADGSGRVREVDLSRDKAQQSTWDPNPFPHDNDVHRIQLIACLGQASTGELIRVCHFNNGETRPLYQGIYPAVLYEAKTGRHIASERIFGKRDAECPFTALSPTGNLHSEPGLIELRQALGQYVEQ